ncbi:MAG: polysaccharide biosynthesis tyrosine autokinase [Cyanobacteria bacterium P01_F01_bin.150]
MVTTPTAQAPEPIGQGEEGGLQLASIFSALKRRWLVIAGVTTVITSAAVLKALTDTPIFQAQFEILTQSVTLETRIISTANAEGLSTQEDLIGSSPDDVKLRILKSPKILEPILEDIQVRHPSLSYRQLYNGISINVTPGDILIVSFKNENRALVEDTLAVLAESYIQYSLEDRQGDIGRGITFVEEQLPVLQDRVDFLQDNLEDLRRNHNLTDPILQGQQLTQRVGGLKQEQLQIDIQLKEAQQIYNVLQQEISVNGDDAVSSLLQADANYQSIQKRLLDIDTELAQQSVLLLETSPEIQYLLEQRQSLTSVVQQESGRIQREILNRIQELGVRNQVLQETIETLNLQIKELSSITRSYTDIQRELNIATTNLNEFLGKREALRIESAQRQFPWEILTQPSSPRASVASAKSNLVLGGILGLILGSGLALVLDQMRSVIESVKDLKDVVNLPLLGVIPFNSSFVDDVVANVVSQIDNSKWLETLQGDTEPMALQVRAFTESFRSLNANLQLICPDKPIRSLAIGAATPNEGKSTVALYLAQAAAVMGQRVLLVDADLRRPSLHHKLGLTNDYGLMDVLISEISVQDVMQPSIVSSNLFVLTTGAIPPDPPAVLASGVMANFNKQAQNDFDLVIYDTPPLLGFADASLTANLAKNLLMVAGFGRVKRSQLKTALDELKIPGINILGIVANMDEEQALSFERYKYYSAVKTESTVKQYQQ